MLPILGSATRLCDGISRRQLLQIGGLGFSGLSLADVFRHRAHAGQTEPSNKSVIMIWLRGGASHIDSYDMKPDAPAEIRGEFRPIATNVPGIQLCEHLPLQAQMMDRLTILQGIRSNDLGDHTPHYIMTGHADRGKRPIFGAVVSYLQPRTDGVPPYASLMYKPPGLYDNEGPTYLGPSHRPFVPRAEGLSNLTLAKGISVDRLHDRRQLLTEFDRLNREMDRNTLDSLDVHTNRALQMITSTRVRDALDLSRESESDRNRYGKFCESFLMARRLVEAGVSVVTAKVGDWDTHEKNFIDHRWQLPLLDQGIHALVTDLYERGLDRNVAVVVWGEFGRAPRISRGDGRDHWPQAGTAVIAGGGFRSGQVIGATDRHGGESLGTTYTPSNVLASLYDHLGIDPRTTIPDYLNRPLQVLDEVQPVRELHSHVVG